MLKNLIWLFVGLFVLSCTDNQTASVISKQEQEILYLKQLFEQWKLKEIAQGRLWALDSCNSEWIMNHPSDREKTWGIPKNSSLYSYSYADLNKDGKIDQLVSFTPNQCDGGNASQWDRINILTISGEDMYTSMDGQGLKMSLNTEEAYCWFDSIGVNKIYVTLYRFNGQSSGCCPEFQHYIMAYDSRTIISEGKIAGVKNKGEEYTKEETGSATLISSVRNGYEYVLEPLPENTFRQLKPVTESKQAEIKKITDLATVRELLDGEVVLTSASAPDSEGANPQLQKIQCKNGKRIDLQKDEVYFIAYYPDYHILVCEGGHASDQTFDVYTGEEEDVVGHPEYMTTSSDRKYRINGYHTGQECAVYFLERYNEETGRYVKMINLDREDLHKDSFEVCFFKEAFWTDSDDFCFARMNFSTRRMEYYKLNFAKLAGASTRTSAR